jgi:hypothetical protein
MRLDHFVRGDAREKALQPLHVRSHVIVVVAACANPLAKPLHIVPFFLVEDAIGQRALQDWDNFVERVSIDVLQVVANPPCQLAQLTIADLAISPDAANYALDFPDCPIVLVRQAVNGMAQSWLSGSHRINGRCATVQQHFVF